MATAKMIFKTPKATDRTNPIIRLQPSVASRVYEIVEQTGLTPIKSSKCSILSVTIIQ